MSNHIGECFEGVISGVTEWGFFVELPNTVEGLVRVTDLTDDFYEFYEDTYELTGTATNKRYKLGQKSRLLWTVLTKLCVQLILNRRNNMTIMTKSFMI